MSGILLRRFKIDSKSKSNWSVCLLWSKWKKWSSCTCQENTQWTRSDTNRPSDKLESCNRPEGIHYYKWLLIRWMIFYRSGLVFLVIWLWHYHLIIFYPNETVVEKMRRLIYWGGRCQLVVNMHNNAIQTELLERGARQNHGVTIHSLERHQEAEEDNDSRAG